MPFAESNGVRYFTFDLFLNDTVHAVFTRNGGVSPAPWTSLNVGGTVGDERARVIENRIRSFQAMGRDPHSIFDVWQVHSADVVVVNAPHDFSPPEFKADAMVTDQANVTLFMRFADCVPILLHDPRKGVVGIVHSGWVGTVKKAAPAAVKTMMTTYGCNPADIRAGIGPSIGPDHYEVGPDVIARVREAFNGTSASLLQQHNARTHFDLWSANRVALEEAGVEQVEIAGQCTACHPEDWFSHREQKGKTGRFGALIALVG